MRWRALAHFTTILILRAPAICFIARWGRKGIIIYRDGYCEIYDAISVSFTNAYQFHARPKAISQVIASVPTLFAVAEDIRARSTPGSASPRRARRLAHRAIYFRRI